METKKNTKNWTAKEENKKVSDLGVTKVHNLLIVDESGSMNVIYQAALDGMNETLNSIKKSFAECPQQAQEVTLVTFDTSHYNKIFDSTPATETRSLSYSDYRPGGATPLYDAMGKALTELEPKVKEKEAVLVTVITDGYENASCEYSLADIRALVERLDKAGWLFSYIGANQNSAEVGNSMGIQDTMDFKATEEDMHDMWQEHSFARNDYVKASRCTGFAPQAFERGSFFKNSKRNKNSDK